MSRCHRPYGFVNNCNVVMFIPIWLYDPGISWMEWFSILEIRLAKENYAATFATIGAFSRLLRRLIRSEAIEFGLDFKVGNEVHQEDYEDA